MGVRSGTVSYVGPGEDFERGPTGYELRVEARGPEGLTAAAAVAVTVLDVAEAPAAVGVIPAQALDEGAGPVTLELSAYFAAGDALRYEAASANEASATVSVSGSTLTVTAVGRGEALVTVTARDSGGLRATQAFGVTVSDRWVRVVAENALAAQARGHLSSARMTLGRRAESLGGGPSRVTVAGQAVPLGSPDTAGMWLGSAHSWQLRETAARYRLSAFDPTGVLARPGPAASVGGLSPLGGLGSYRGGMEHALLGSDFLLSGAGGQDEPGGRGRGRGWTVWGQGDLQTFRGDPVGTPLELGYDGDLRTWYLGVDEALGERWLVGMALARSEGGGAWGAGSATGRLSSALTAMHPYLRWGRGDTTVWALLGVGRGTISNVRAANGVEETSGLGLNMGLVEARRRLATVGGGVRLGLRGEASWARLATDAGEETIAAFVAAPAIGRDGEAAPGRDPHARRLARRQLGPPVNSLGSPARSSPATASPGPRSPAPSCRTSPRGEFSPEPGQCVRVDHGEELPGPPPARGPGVHGPVVFFALGRVKPRTWPRLGQDRLPRADRYGLR